MKPGRIIRILVLLVLLVWAPASTPEPRHPRHAPPAEGSWLDVGLRVDPERPWTSWQLYLDLYREPEGEGEPQVSLELDLTDLPRVAGGAGYVVLRDGLSRR